MKNNNIDYAYVKQNHDQLLAQAGYFYIQQFFFCLSNYRWNFLNFYCQCKNSNSARRLKSKIKKHEMNSNSLFSLNVNK